MLEDKLMSHVTVVTVFLVERYFFLPTFLEKSPDFFRKTSRGKNKNLPMCFVRLS